MTAISGSNSLAASALSDAAGFKASSTSADTPAKARDAGEQFEALMIAQLLSSARAGNGWLEGEESDSAGSCATDYAEQKLAAVMAKQGGFGLRDLVVKGFDKRTPGAIISSSDQ
jgi:Rod binding domain-containing protein